MGTLLVERRSADALAVAEVIQSELPELEIAEWFETPQLIRFRLNHATLLLRRGAADDAARARQLVMDLANDPAIRAAELDPNPVVYSDDARARALPSLLLALNRFGEHLRAARFGERLMAAETSGTARYHSAALNTALCWTAHGLVTWAAGRVEEATEHLDRAITLLESEIHDDAAFLATETTSRLAALLLRESNLCYAKLWRLVVTQTLSEASLNEHQRHVRSVLERSEMNAAVGPVTLTLRYSRFGEGLVERALLVEASDPQRSAELAMAALIYFSARWQLYLLDNDLPLSVTLRYSEARRLAGDPLDARAVLTRAAAQMHGRFGADYPGLQLVRERAGRLRPQHD